MIEVDARGLSCPHPVLALRQALRQAPAGTRARLLATDPLASVDVRAWCLRGGHRVLEESEVDGELQFVVERGT